MRRGVALLLSLSAALPAGSAAAQAPPDSARRAALAALPEGALVRLREVAGARRQGTVVALRGDSLHLRDTWRGRPYAVSVASVDFAEVRAPGNRSRGAAVGALVGATLGVVSGGFADGTGDLGAAVVAGALANGLLGGAIGYVASAGGWRQVWPAPAAAP